MNRNIYARTGNSTVNVSGLCPSWQPGVQRGGGVDLVIGPNLTNTFDITGDNSGRLSLPGLSPLSFSFVESVGGNNQADRVLRFGASGSLTGTIDGGMLGVDTLDYSAKNVPISVNLLAGTATSTRGVSRIENVTGASRNDTLIGNRARQRPRCRRRQRHRGRQRR